MGAGRARPQGRRALVADEPTVAALRAAIEAAPAAEDGWWSPHLFAGDYRDGANWEGAWGIPVDVDYHGAAGEHAAVPPDAAARLAGATAYLPGSLFHPTPRGARLVILLDEFVRDATAFDHAALAAGRTIDSILRQLGLAAKTQVVPGKDGRPHDAWCAGFKVDDPLLTDRARLFFLPNARVDGVDRVGLLQTLSGQPYSIETVAAWGTGAGTEDNGGGAGEGDDAKEPGRRAHGTIDEAVAAYLADHPRQYPKSHGECPACGHADCFGHMPDNPARWACFSSDHGVKAPGCGLPGKACYHGDALDLDACAAGTDRIGLLRREGYLKRGRSRRSTGGGEARSWSLGVGEYVVVGWPKGGRPLFVTLEFRYEGFRAHRDNLDLNSKKSRKQFAEEAARNLPDLVDGAAEKVESDLRNLIGLVEAATPHYQADVDGAEESAADKLVALAKGAELFHDDGDRAFATFPVENHRETCPVRSTRFKNWLRFRFHKEHGKVPNSQALNDALGVLEGMAQIEGPMLVVHVRVAQHDGAVYLDLGRPKWEAVRIDGAGWSIVSDVPVRFVRPPGLLPLPEPVRGGSLDELRPFVNLRHQHDRVLFLAWLVAALRPGRPFPVLVLTGEQGTAKSTAVRVARALIDPNKAALRSTPRNEHDLVIAARNGWCLAYDNISYVPPWLSDAICRVATGAGFGTRKLYSDDEEEIFEACRPIVVNGIEEIATRGDLVDRSLLLFLDRIDEEDRKDEETFWADFAAVHARVLGALLDALATALRNLPAVRLGSLPRMADFAKLGVAAEPALGCRKGAFLDAYSDNREGALSGALDASVFGNEFAAWARRLGGPFEGNATDLLELLNSAVEDKTKREKGWPKAPNALSGLLRRLAPSLRASGIAVEFVQEGGSGGRKLIRLWLQDIDADRRTDAKGSGGVDGVGGVDDLHGESGPPNHSQEPPNEPPEEDFEEGAV